jgi:Zn finger protein HypA/HybF involved in hydrogenase expression
MKLIEIDKPTPKCKRCKVHLHTRMTHFGMLYDCPNCQATYKEIKQKEKVE